MDVAFTRSLVDRGLGAGRDGREDCRDLHNLSRARVRITRGCTFRVKNRRDTGPGDSAGTILPPGPPFSPRNKGKWSEPRLLRSFSNVTKSGSCKKFKIQVAVRYSPLLAASSCLFLGFPAFFLRISSLEESLAEFSDSEL